jgi:hypothetical protein
MAYSMAYAKPACERIQAMVKRFYILLAALGAVATAMPAEAKPRNRDQDVAFEATQQGRIMPLRVIERRIVPQMRGAEYLGPELDNGRYRLKFVRTRDGRVIWVDVDGRSGRVVGRSGD